MALQCLTVQLKFVGSGTGPQTHMPYGAASCGHDALACHQGQLLTRAAKRLRLLPDQEPGSALCELCWPATGPAFESF